MLSTEPLLITLILFFNTLDATPVVIWHGLGQSCCDPAAIGRVKMIIANVTKAYVVSIKVSRPSSRILRVISRGSDDCVEEIYTHISWKGDRF